ncbi:MAG: excalibur calcium-binding domain-containing protein [Bifidobacteriaceae bacterium]|nr:excalibur calcium-binding domain-containing protein [Bifidobacteriaceae bacterium]
MRNTTHTTLSKGKIAALVCGILAFLGIAIAAIGFVHAAAATHQSTHVVAQSAAKNTAVSGELRTTTTGTVTTAAARKGNARTALNKLPVKGRAPKTGYSRAKFGPAWADVNHNGCDTRNDVLKRDLTGEKFKKKTHNCVITSGTLKDPYTKKTIHFVRGTKTSIKVQIDHVVALSDAWQTGAQKLSSSTRKKLANDPYNLLAVDGPTNMKKNASDAASWLPSNKAFRCEYVARQIGVKQRYKLWVTSAEKSAMARILSTCPSQSIPTKSGVVNKAAVSSSKKTTSKKSTKKVVKKTKKTAKKSTKKSTKKSSKKSSKKKAPAKKAKKKTTKKSTKKKSTKKKSSKKKSTKKKAPAKKKTTKKSSKKKSTKKSSKKSTKKKTTKKKSTKKSSKKKAPAKKTATVRYKNCAAVWKAVHHGIHKGDKGYSRALDRDGDGKACEIKPRY